MFMSDTTLLPRFQDRRRGENEMMMKDQRFNGAFSGGSANPSGSAGGGGGEWTERGGLCSQTSGNTPISSDMMRGVMDGSAALFGN